MANDVNLPVRVIRYGVDEPPPERRLLRAGPITAAIEGSNLRYVRTGDVEIVRGIYMAVRNRNWDSPPPHFLSYQVDQSAQGFTVRFRAEHADAGVDFVWDGTITGSADGIITYAMDGEVRHDFWRGRIGICLLQPMSLAGVSTEVQMVNGPLVKKEFPVRISPHQPFTDMGSMRYEVGNGIRVEIDFEGDLFEMEDQRNWTDASYKTYSTPLRIPYPVEVHAGDKVKQTLRITVRNAKGKLPVQRSEPEIRISTRSTGPLPGLGLGTASSGRTLGPTQRDALKRLSLDHLWHEVQLLQPDWESRVRGASEEARNLGVALEVAAVTDANATNLHRLIQLISSGDVQAGRLSIFDLAKHTTTRHVAEKTRQALAAMGLNIPFGGGSRAYFTEFNRADLPLDLLDFAVWGISPQVHAFDNASLVETLQAQAVTVESGRAIAGSLPLEVGPITLKPRYNPNATGPAPRLAPGDLPSEVDPRQMSLFAAAWVVGSIRYLGSAGVHWLTYFETRGWRGILDDPAAGNQRFPMPAGAVYPVYHVFADVGEFAGSEVLEVSTSDPLAVEALALRSGNRIRILVANLAGEQERIRLSLPSSELASLRVLDETTAGEAMKRPDDFRQRVDRQFDPCPEQVELDLAPYAVARLDATLT